MANKVDVVIIGGGPGGTPAAMQLAAKGKKVLLVEASGKLGGACLFVGCIPSKIIKHFADEPLSQHRPLAFKWERIKDRMERILGGRSNAAIKKLNALPSATFIPGKASFISNNEVSIEKKDGGKETYTFDNAIIATGATSFIPPFKGDGVKDVLTNETFFALEDLPESLLIVGGGPIGVELAQMLTKLGVKCTIVELLDTILYGIVDPEFVGILTKKLKDDGIDIYTSSKVKEINKYGRGFRTIFEDPDKKDREIKTDQVLVVTGKVPNVEGLNLDATDIKYDRKGILTDEYLQTTVSGIYATGDVIQGPKFAHTATYESNIAAMNILMGNNQKVDFSKNSWVLFSEPEVASVGYDKKKAEEAGYEVITGVYNYNIDAAAQVRNNPMGYLKFVVDKKTLEILGVHIFGASASSIVGEASLIVANRLTLKDVAQAIHPHPTLTEAFGVLAIDMLVNLNK